ncbi:MAG TPA: hypothetical protein VF730_14645 [Terracidiphilus sp.]
MNGIHELRDVSDWVFLAAFFLLPAVTPSVIFSFIRMQNKETGIKLAYWKKLALGALAGFIGEVVAIGMFFSALSKICRYELARGSYCSGEEPLILVFAVPLCAVVASCISMFWTWRSMRIRSNSRWASVFSYSGKDRAMNAGCAVIVQAIFWASFTFAVYRLYLP